MEIDADPIARPALALGRTFCDGLMASVSYHLAFATVRFEVLGLVLMRYFFSAACAALMSSAA
jgi:hypothetical protein